MFDIRIDTIHFKGKVGIILVLPTGYDFLNHVGPGLTRPWNNDNPAHLDDINLGKDKSILRRC
jgi:hypothetical protein